ncbi:hypothetical protein HPG69_017474 [Diceros bicornis minor]|uniref:Insulin-like 3 n=1 Tax=Diceros bicornis minor TaxID=77932 RepID=A0A7J7ED90_DICBM|nr:hypothetical protein HPG69_017474 [Diceros bicornis minor]
MDPRRRAWALLLLGPVLALALGGAPAPEAPEKLCGHHFVRALVRVCGGPRWSPGDGRPVAGGDRECRRARTAPGVSRGASARPGPAGGYARTSRVYLPLRGCARIRGGRGPCPAGIRQSEAVLQVQGELLQWLEGRHLLHGLPADGDPSLALAPPPPSQASRHRHHRRAAATNPAHHCCLSGCTRQDLLTLCPH